jgi:hypothetical protein
MYSVCEPRWPFDSKRPSDGSLSTAPDVSYVVKDSRYETPGLHIRFFQLVKYQDVSFAPHPMCKPDPRFCCLAVAPHPSPCFDRCWHLRSQSCRRGGGFGNGDPERRTLARHGRHTNLTAMSLHDAFDDGQAGACAWVGLAGVEPAPQPYLVQRLVKET